MNNVDSGLLELMNAVEHLCDRGDMDITEDGKYEEFDTIYNALLNAGNAAEYISDTFQDVNNTLVSGWESVADFFYRVENAVHYYMLGVQNAIRIYIESSKAIAMEEVYKTENVSEETSNILSEMGLEG